MMEISQKKEKIDYSLNKKRLQKLLSFFDRDEEKAGKKYEEVRKLLIKKLEFQGSPTPESHADLCIDKVARQLADENLQLDENYKYYFLQVANFTLNDYWKSREHKKKETLDDKLPNELPFIDLRVKEKEKEAEELSEKERKIKFDCMKKCLDKLKEPDKNLIIDYYQLINDENNKEQRENLAKKYGISLKNLRVKIYRMKEKLKICEGNCLNNEV